MRIRHCDEIRRNMSTKIIGVDCLHFLVYFEVKLFVHFVVLILAAKYCLGRAMNVTEHRHRSSKFSSVSEYETGLYRWNSSVPLGGNLNNDDLNKQISSSDKNIPTNASRNTGLTTEQPDSELPLPILIASPVAAISIVILICIAYKWHSVQLDEQAKKLAIERAADQCPSPCDPCSPCRTTQRLVPSGQARADGEVTGGRRKSLRTPTPPPSVSRSSRASLWSADQEVLTHVHSSPRRHSTFIL